MIRFKLEILLSEIFTLHTLISKLFFWGCHVSYYIPIKPVLILQSASDK